jgi:uncharacterized membrane protein
VSSRRRRLSRAEQSVRDRDADPAVRRATSGALAAASVAALVATYLVVEHVTGGPLVCGPFAGCDTVQASSYATIGIVPVALPGAIASILILGLLAQWWRRRDRRALAAAYVLGLGGAVVLGYLTWLELVVIHAVCSWCVGYAIASLATLGLVGWLMRRIV